MATEFREPSRRPANLALHVSGAALFFVGLGIIVAAAVDLGAGGDDASRLALSSVLVTTAGAVVWRGTAIPERVTAARAFQAVAATWVVASLGGAVPFLLTSTFPTWDAAVFEAISGFTGTGSTVLDPIEDAGRGVLFWRSMTQFYGGTGMVVLAVAILPFLGIGGMELLRTEAPGPTTDRLAPRVSETAKRLWLVYGGFTVISVVILLITGMSPFDATTHAFTVVSTGGLSPYNNSIAAFDSQVVETVLVVLMLIGGANFTLHWRFLTGDRTAHLRSPLFRFYAQVWIVAVAAIVVILVQQDGFTIAQAVRDATFNVTTLLTSTGFGTVDYVAWAAGAQMVLLALMVSGGMAGSTAGGLKLIRVRILLVYAWREVRRIRRPRAVLPIRYGNEPVPELIVRRVVGFALLYVLFAVSGTLILALLGTGLIESAGAAISSMSNIGPSLGEAGPASNYLVFSRPARGVIMVLMLAGRLEIMPILLGVLSLWQSTRTQRMALSPSSSSAVRERRQRSTSARMRP